VAHTCLLLETCGKIMLFDNDTGSSKHNGPYDGKLLVHLREPGFETNDIDAVVLVHTHSGYCE
jgi:metal-dependent hydrolase (beta-lactamase superfamily II)